MTEMMNRPVIPHAPASLEELYEMIKELRPLRQRGDRIGEQVIIAGAWCIDEFGQQHRVVLGDNQTLRDIFPDFPMYLNDADLQRFLDEHDVDSYMTCGSPIPPPYVSCEGCGKSWTLDDIHDVKLVVTHELELVPLDAFAGRKFNEARDDIARALGSVGTCIPAFLRHARRTNVCDDGVPDDLILRIGDTAECTIRRFRHRSCHRKLVYADQEESFRKAFAEANIEVVAMKRYYQNDRRSPWFYIFTTVGTFIVGPRKRVYHLELKCGHPINFEKVFSDQNVTKGKHYIHAWSDQALVEYLTRINLELTKAK